MQPEYHINYPTHSARSTHCKHTPSPVLRAVVASRFAGIAILASLQLAGCAVLPSPYFMQQVLSQGEPAIHSATPAISGAPNIPQEIHIGSLRLIGQQVLPRRMEFAGTIVGGLSGIDFDAQRGDYVLISDDRTPQDSPNPPRMYRAKLDVDAQGFRAVRFTGIHFLRQPDGQVYPKTPQPGTPDPEAIRIDPVTRNLVWVSEGERVTASGNPRITDPFIREVTAAGAAVREYSLPDMFRMPTDATVARGPRNNAVFEGLSFTPDGSRLAVIMEAPLIEDGEPPTLNAGSWSRLTLFDRVSGRAVAQYAYPIERVQVAPSPPDAFRINGPSEILALSATRFLVLERSFSVGVTGNQVRLYEIDVQDATDILGQLPATRMQGLRTVSKRLVLDFESLKNRLGGIANLEGMTFGPRLANGNALLVMVADDNFPQTDSDTDRNQFLAFEVLPSR